MSKITSTQITLGLGIVVLGAAYFIGKKALSAAGNTAASVGQALNPTSTENIFYKGTSGLVNAVAADGRDAPLGVRIWEWLNPDKVAAERALTQPVQVKSVAEPNTWTGETASRGASGSWNDPAGIQYGELNQWGA